MSLPIGPWLKLTLENPTEAAKHVLSTTLDREYLWSLLTLTSVLTVLMFLFMQMAFPAPPDAALTLPFLDSPLLFGLVMWGSLVLLVYCVHYIGQMFGGVGRFEQSIMLVIWVQFLLMVSQVAQLVVAIVSIPMAAFLGLGFFVFWVWIFASFVAVLHQFENRGLVLGGIAMSFLGVLFGLSLLITIVALIFGIELPNDPSI